MNLGSTTHMWVMADVRAQWQVQEEIMSKSQALWTTAILETEVWEALTDRVDQCTKDN